MLAAQILAMLENDLWLDNARAANAAAQTLAAAAPRPAGLSGRGQRDFPQSDSRGSRCAALAGLRLLRLGARRNPAGHQLGPGTAGRSTSSPRPSPHCEAAGRPFGRHPLHHLHRHLGVDLDRHPRPARHRPGAMVDHLPLRHRRAGDGRHHPLQGAEPQAAAARHRPGRDPRRAAVRDQLQRRLFRRASHHLGPGGGGVRAAADPQQPARLGVSRPAPERAASPGARCWRSPASSCCSRTSFASIRRGAMRS